MVYLIIPKTEKNCIDSLFRNFLNTLGYDIPQGECQDKICIAELVLATLYLVISLITFRMVEPSVFFLGLIWGFQVSLGLLRVRVEEQKKSIQLIHKYKLDDTIEVKPPADRRLLLIAVLFLGLFLLLGWHYLMTFLSAESVASTTIWDWICSIIYICAYVEQAIEILINLYGAEMHFSIVFIRR